MVTVILRGPHEAALSADVPDVLWVAASLDPAVEHLHVNRPGTGGAGHLTFFITAQSRGTAVTLVREITCRALENSPALAGWHLV